MRLGPGRYVDAGASYGVLARYINDPRHPRASNVTFVKRPSENRAVVRATRYIAPGEELFVSYGPAYWLAAKTAGLQPTSLPEGDVRRVLARARRLSTEVLPPTADPGTPSSS
mmetsp:Transcript_11811/g.38891  ORF Transcript_11811/g.38891 Transcript_11811/m.38891 type:complete len:113 (+) Transcript_11811:936-1274(+)